MDFTQFLNLSDSWKVFLVDMFPADEVEDLDWSQTFPAPFNAWTGRKLFALPIPTADLTDFPVKVPIIADAEIGAKCLANVCIILYDRTLHCCTR